MILRAAFIGAGDVAHKRCSLLRELSESGQWQWEVAAWVDLAPAKAEVAAARFGGNIYSSPTRLLSAEKVDAVFVAIPAGARGPAETAIVKNGTALWLESPVGTSARTFAALSQTVKRLGIPVMVSAPWRYDANIERARKLLALKSGISPTFWSGLITAPLGDGVWRRDAAQSGGVWLEVAWPLLDMARYLGGELRIIQSRGDVKAGTANALAQFKSGALANWSAGHFGPAQSRLETWGSQTRVTLSDFSTPQLSIESNGETRVFAGDNSGERLQLESFSRLIAQGKRTENRATVADALETLKLALAARGR